MEKLSSLQIEQIKEARKQLWYKGILTFKLDENQKFLYEMYKKTPEKIIVWNCSRGLGKSTMLCVIAIEECLRNPKALVKYACPKQKDATQIIAPIFRDILEDCPEEIKPKFIKGEGAWRFPNGAQIQLAGLDNNRAESLRGGSAVLAIVDEAGARTLKDLEYIVKSILYPAVTRKKDVNGKIILASTPPISPSHPFVHFLRRAEKRNCAVTRDIYTIPKTRFTKEMLADLIEEYGIDSNHFKREYLCHIIPDTNYVVVPEFTEELQKKIIQVWPKPAYFDAYVGMDLGVKDLTVALFAYYDFKAAKLIIEDEFVTNGQKFNTKFLADGIKEKEAVHFVRPNTGEKVKPLKRVCDNNLIVINDLHQLHQLEFQATKKDDADAALNNMKITLSAEKIVINPRCVTLITHLRDATWNKSKSSYERDPEDGHYDAVDSLKYLIRNVNFNKNPYPKWFGFNTGEGFFIQRDPVTSAFKDQVKTILNIIRK
jgi:hypothetical protein